MLQFKKTCTTKLEEIKSKRTCINTRLSNQKRKLIKEIESWYNKEHTRLKTHKNSLLFEVNSFVDAAKNEINMNFGERSLLMQNLQIGREGGFEEIDVREKLLSEINQKITNLSLKRFDDAKVKIPHESDTIFDIQLKDLPSPILPEEISGDLTCYSITSTLTFEVSNSTLSIIGKDLPETSSYLQMNEWVNMKEIYLYFSNFKFKERDLEVLSQITATLPEIEIITIFLDKGQEEIPNNQVSAFLSSIFQRPTNLKEVGVYALDGKIMPADLLIALAGKVLPKIKKLRNFVLCAKVKFLGKI